MKRQIFCSNVALSLVVAILFSSLAVAAPVQLIGGGPYDFDESGISDSSGILHQPGTVSGQLAVLGCTLNFKSGAEIIADPGGAGPGNLIDYSGAIINISGGIIPGMIQSGNQVMVEGSNFAVDGAAIDPSISIYGPAVFYLTGLYPDGTDCVLNVDLLDGAQLSFNELLPPVPTIDVLPALSPYPIGETEIGTSLTTNQVQIFNNGTGDLEVELVSIDGSIDFSITSAKLKDALDASVEVSVEFPYECTVLPTVDGVTKPYLEIEVTFTPTQFGDASTTVTIVSNDEEAGVVEKVLTAVGTTPDILVHPESREYDYGDVEIGQSQSYVVQMLNDGTADLVVDSITLDGASEFTITSELVFPLVIAPSETVGVDVEITFTPTVEGYVSTILNIESNDLDEPLVQVVLGGVGIVLEIPPAEQIQNILDYLDAAVEEGTIMGYGPGRCNRPEKRLRALRHMIKGAGSLIDAGYDQWAICVLRAVDRKTDGERRPPDFVMGDGVEALNQMINDLIDDLSS